MSPDSFEQFLKEHRHKIYGYLLRFVDVDDDAQDLLQEVCIAFYRRIDSIRPETAVCYMYRMAHNTALNWRKQRNRTLLKPAMDFERIPGTVPMTDRYQIVNKAIAQLPANLSAVVHMYYYDRLSYKEISVQTGKSIKAIDSMLDRARSKLRKRIRIDGDGDFELKP